MYIFKKNFNTSTQYTEVNFKQASTNQEECYKSNFVTGVTPKYQFSRSWMEINVNGIFKMIWIINPIFFSIFKVPFIILLTSAVDNLPYTQAILFNITKFETIENDL